MNIAPYVKQVSKTIQDNSPAILTAIGVVGTLTTSVLSVKATYDSIEHLYTKRLVEAEGFINLTDAMKSYSPKEAVKETWKYWLPVLAVGTTTVTCIVMSNKIASNRTTAAIAAYSFAEKAFGEYKDKVVELHGANKEQKIRDEVAQDRVAASPPNDKQIIITGNGDVRCYESLTGRYFSSDMESIRAAVNDINYQINNDMYASLNEFFEKIGLPDTTFGENLGWNTDRGLEVQFSAILAPDGKPCMHLGYLHTPFPNYHHMH